MKNYEFFKKIGFYGVANVLKKLLQKMTKSKSLIKMVIYKKKLIIFN